MPARLIGGHRLLQRGLLLSAWPEHYFISSVITPHSPCGTRGENHSSVGKNYNEFRTRNYGGVGQGIFGAVKLPEMFCE